MVWWVEGATFTSWAGDSLMGGKSYIATFPGLRVHPSAVRPATSPLTVLQLGPAQWGRGRLLRDEKVAWCLESGHGSHPGFSVPPCR